MFRNQGKTSICPGLEENLGRGSPINLAPLSSLYRRRAAVEADRRGGDMTASDVHHADVVTPAWVIIHGVHIGGHHRGIANGRHGHLTHHTLVTIPYGNSNGSDITT